MSVLLDAHEVVDSRYCIVLVVLLLSIRRHTVPVLKGPWRSDLPISTDTVAHPNDRTDAAEKKSGGFGVLVLAQGAVIARQVWDQIHFVVEPHS